jgi:hypothetical protein
MIACVDQRIRGDGERAGADGDMRIAHADRVDDQRHGENGAATARECECEADECTRGDCDQILQWAQARFP